MSETKETFERQLERVRGLVGGDTGDEGSAMLSAKGKTIPAIRALLARFDEAVKLAREARTIARTRGTPEDAFWYVAINRLVSLLADAKGGG